jgi:iron complex outermembrane receptor protein
MRKLFASLALGGSMLPAIAYAAEPNGVAAPAAAAEPTTNAAADDAEQGLNDIVVTATKRETNLQQTPIAIAVVDSQAIKDRLDVRVAGPDAVEQPLAREDSTI